MWTPPLPIHTHQKTICHLIYRYSARILNFSWVQQLMNICERFSGAGSLMLIRLAQMILTGLNFRQDEKSKRKRSSFSLERVRKCDLEIVPIKRRLAHTWDVCFKPANRTSIAAGQRLPDGSKCRGIILFQVRHFFLQVRISFN